MKKILTVSLFAIMAVSAANADIASTDYVGTQMNLAEKIANKVTVVNQDSVDEKYPSAKAVYTAIKSQVEALGDNVDKNIELQLGTVTDQIDEASGKISALETALSATGTTGQAIAAAQAQADKGVADAAAAQAAADAAQGTANANADAISKLDTTYVSESEMNSFKTSNTSAINTAKEAAISAAATDAQSKADAALAAAKEDAKQYIDAGELEASQTAQDTILKKYADDAATAAKTDAEATAAGALAAAKTELEGKITEASTGAGTALTNALQNYSTTTQMNSAITTAKSEAATDAQSKADAALAAAKADATTKAKAAQAAAEGKVTDLAKGQVKTNKEAIAAMDEAYKVADTATLNSAKAFTTEQIGTLSALSTVPMECASGVTDCALVIRNKTITWEKVSY